MLIKFLDVGQGLVSVTKEIKAMGGEIILESEENKGTSFIFFIT